MAGLAQISGGHRAALFLVVCVGTRLVLVALARSVAPHHAPVRYALVAFTAAAAIGFLPHFLFGTRAVAPEAGGVAWWNPIRPLHAALIGLYAVYSLKRYDKTAWLFLLADVALGLAAWSAHRLPLSGGQ